MTTKGEMTFDSWRDGTLRFNLTLNESSDSWVFVANKSSGNRLLNDGGRELYHSVNVGPAWRHWFGMMGPTEYVDDEGQVLVRIERIGLSGNLKISAGDTSAKLIINPGFIKTEYQCRLLHMSLTETQQRVAEFEISPSFNPLAAMAVVGHIAAYFHRG